MQLFTQLLRFFCRHPIDWQKNATKACKRRWTPLKTVCWTIYIIKIFSVLLIIFSSSQPKYQAADNQQQNKHQKNAGVKEQIAKQRQSRPGKKPPGVSAKFDMTAPPKTDAAFFAEAASDAAVFPAAVFHVKIKHLVTSQSVFSVAVRIDKNLRQTAV